MYTTGYGAPAVCTPLGMVHLWYTRVWGEYPGGYTRVWEEYPGVYTRLCTPWWVYPAMYTLVGIPGYMHPSIYHPGR